MRYSNSSVRRGRTRPTRVLGRMLSWFAAVATLAAISPAAAAAQSGSSRIVGRVLDAETGRGLVGALVTVAETSTATIAGLDGRYELRSDGRGPFTLTVSNIGYGEKSVVGVAIPTTGVLNLDVTLLPAALAVEGVTVSVAGERGTVSRALDEQRTAIGVTSTVTAEQISRSPDGDAAAAVQRMSGVTVQDGKYVSVRGLGERYTTTSLNGSRMPSPEPERKMVPLDLFPAGLLQTITTAKTFTPDLPGDFSGAQVDIRTRDYPVGRQLSFSVSQGYNSAATGRTIPMAPTTGNEWLANAKGPRLIPDVVQDTPTPRPGTETNAMVNAMRNAWSVVDRTGRPSGSFAVSLGGSDELVGREVGYLLSGTYSLADEVNVGAHRQSLEGDRYEGTVGRQSVLLGGIFNLSTAFGAHSRVRLNNTYNRTADNEASLEEGFYENHGTSIRIERLRYVERVARSTQLAGEHQIGTRHRLDWSVAASGVSRDEPDRSEYVTWLDPAVPTWYNQEGAFRAYGGLSETSIGASVDYHLELGRHALRFGGLYQVTEREAYDTGYSIRSRQWTSSDPRWQLRPEEFFDGRFAQDGDTLFEIGTFNAGGSYTADDQLVAGYGMLEWQLGPGVRLVTGARIERSGLELAFEDVLRNRGVVEPTYLDVLPSAALNIDVGDAQKLRLSVSQTLARPEYREIAPACYRAGLGEEQRCGNPDLVRTRIQNLDLRWEHYPDFGQVLSVALFAKRFTDPIEARYLGRSGTNSLSFQNAESAMNYGIELEAVRSLDLISERLSSLSAFANATLMKSVVNTGIEGDPHRPMAGQAPYVVNTGLTWTSPSRAASATILFNTVGERIINARPSGQSVNDMLEQARPALDFALRFPVMGTLSGKLDLKNLLDSPYEVRQGDLVRAYYRSGRGASLGFSWRQ